jgi:tryptophan halogenase
MINRTQKIIIFGGGTSGWLSAAYLTHNLQVPCEITLIEDTTLGPIGVGEGTQPLTAQFLFQCGLNPSQWMKPSNAAFKLGVELVGWNDDPYFVDNDGLQSSLIAEDLYTSDYFIKKPYSDFAKFHPAYQLAKANLSPKLFDHLDTSFGANNEGYGAVHFSAYEILDALKELIGNKIKHIDTRIAKVEKDLHGITKLIDDKGQSYSADLYIDCSGFNSILLEKTLGVPFTSYDKWLPNDRAVVMPTQFKDPETECFPYTKATTMSAGWRFTIPIYTRTGNGYVYSSKFISDEDAEKELRETIGEFEAPAKFLKMKCGYHKEIAVKNVVAVGLSAGFVEPLEATGITFTTAVIKSVTELLNMNRNIWNQPVKELINRGFYEMNMEILTFVWAHYHFSKRADTPFWQSIRQQQIKDLPEDVQFVLSHFYPRPGRFLYFSKSSMFNIVQWFSVLHAGGAYNNLEKIDRPNENEYAEYFIDVQNYRVEQAKKRFPNHYAYLDQWYKHNS